MLFKDIPKFEESIDWSNYLWKEGLEDKRITINMLIKQYQEQNLNFEKKMNLLNLFGTIIKSFLEIIKF